MPIKCRQIHVFSTGGARMVRLNCADDMASGASLAGTPSVTEVTSSDLTLTYKAVNSAAYDDDATGDEVAIGKGIEFHVTGGLAETEYTVLVSCDTDETPADTLEYELTLIYT